MTQPQYGEPWRIEMKELGRLGEETPYIMDRKDYHVEGVHREASHEHLRRIVACVNACAGVSDEALDRWLEHLKRCGAGDAEHLEQFFDESDGW